MSATERTSLVSAKRHAGPNLLALTIVYVAFLIAGGAKVKPAFHVPHDDAGAVAFVAANSLSIRLGSFFELASAIPLGIFFVTTTSRLRFLGVRAAGESIASFGGIGASLMVMFSGLCTWSITRPGIAEATGAVRALEALGFIGGGPGFAVLLGLFLAGVSVSAGLPRLIPRWLMWLGLSIALACELASLTLINFTAGYFIPVGRFLSIVWMIGVSVTLPRSLAAASAAPVADRAA
jgi:hypothetical protein